MKTHYKIGLNTIYQLLGRVCTALIGLVVTRLVSGSYGVEGFGDYQIVLTYVTFFWILTDFGLNTISVREMSIDEESLPEKFSLLLTLRVLAGLVICVIANGILIFLPYSNGIKFAIVFGTLTIFLQSLFGAANGLFQVRLRYDRQLLSNILGGIVGLISYYLSIRLGYGLYGLIGAFVLSAASMAGLNIWFASRWVPLRLHWDQQKVWKLVKETIPLGVVILFSLAIFKIDSIFLSLLTVPHESNAYAVGVYNLAYKIFELIIVIPAFFMNPVYPVMVRRLSESFELFVHVVKRAYTFLIVSSISVVIGIYVCAPFLVGILSDNNENFNDAVYIVRILSAFTPVFFTTSLLMWILVTFRSQKWLMLIYGIGLSSNIILNRLFIPQYGYWAAAVNTGITEVILLLLLVIFVYREWRRTKVISAVPSDKLPQSV